MVRRALSAGCVGLALVGLCGCGDDLPALYVDLRTDYVVGVEIARARTFVSRDGRVLGMGDADLRGRDTLEGVRIAEIEELEPGSLSVVVDLVAPDGRTTFTRRLRVTLTEDLAVTVVASRSCDGVVCPGPGDRASSTECLGGLCVEEGCARLGGECGSAACTVATDCPAPSAVCAQAVCRSGVCLVAARAGACATGEACVPDRGCVAVAEVDAARPDAGPADGGPAPTCATGCDDGDPCTDDVCADGACTFPPVTSSVSCADGDACTHSDRCEGGVCRGTSYACADPGDCQTASCDGSGGCSTSGGCGPGSVCRDGGCVPCGGADAACCAGGGCNSGLWCFAGVCTCGQGGGPCCPWDSSCAPGLACGGGTCCVPLGGACGSGMGTCCDGVPCRSGICFE